MGVCMQSIGGFGLPGTSPTAAGGAAGSGPGQHADRAPGPKEGGS